MRILILHEDKRSYGQGGGAESFLRDTTKALTDRGHEVRWYQGEGGFSELLEDWKPDICQIMTVHNFMGFTEVRWLQANKYPHVWLLMDYWPFCGGRMLLKIYDVGCAAVEGVCDGNCPDGKAPFMYMEMANGSPIVALNPYTADIYRRNGLRCDYVLTLGVDHEFFVPDPGKRIEGSISTMSSWPAFATKGMHILREAVAKTGYSASLITGQPREVVREELQKTDIFVFPSTYQETWGLCLTEAMACGCACIAADVAGPRHQVEHGVNGLLYPPRDVDKLVEHLELLVNHVGVRADLGYQARKTVEERMTLDYMGQQYEKIYGDVIDGS